MYIVAALIKSQSFQSLHEVFTTHYLIPSSDRYGERVFDTFYAFYGHSETLQSVLAPEGQSLYSPAAEFIYKNADREDLPFKSVLEAELLILMMAFLDPNSRWFPQTLYYAPHAGGDFPLFLRATQHKFFMKFAIITNIEDANTLREMVKAGYERLGVQQWANFHFRNFWEMMNMDKLDTLK